MKFSLLFCPTILTYLLLLSHGLIHLYLTLKCVSQVFVYFVVTVPALVVVLLYMLLITYHVVLSHTPLVHQVMMLNICGSQLAPLDRLQPALFWVAFIALQVYPLALWNLCA
jgi:hypothetical protein